MTESDSFHQANLHIFRQRETAALRDVLQQQVARLEQAYAEGSEFVRILARSHAMQGEPTVERAQWLVAREHGFRGWEDALVHGDRVVDATFETAADAIVEGDLVTLHRLLHAQPHLVSARSPYRHQCTLLHHVSANGIEHSRQWQSPRNAPDVARTLLAAGADADARCAAYDCDTPLTLLLSSIHPAVAGVQEDLVEVLCRGGARPNGPDEDGAPLWTAILWGYLRAARRIVQCGARVNNLIFAAAVGDLDQVRSYIQPDGGVVPGSLGSLRIQGQPLDEQHAKEYALIYSTGSHRLDIIEYLLSLKPDLAFREPMYGATALGAATYPHGAAGRPQGNEPVAELLRRAMAPQ